MPKCSKNYVEFKQEGLAIELFQLRCCKIDLELHPYLDFFRLKPVFENDGSRPADGYGLGKVVAGFR